MACKQPASKQGAGARWPHTLRPCSPASRRARSRRTCPTAPAACCPCRARAGGAAGRVGPQLRAPRAGLALRCNTRPPGLCRRHHARREGEAVADVAAPGFGRSRGAGALRAQALGQQPQRLQSRGGLCHPTCPRGRCAAACGWSPWHTGSIAAARQARGNSRRAQSTGGSARPGASAVPPRGARPPGHPWPQQPCCLPALLNPSMTLSPPPQSRCRRRWTAPSAPASWPAGRRRQWCGPPPAGTKEEGAWAAFGMGAGPASA